MTSDEPRSTGARVVTRLQSVRRLRLNRATSPTALANPGLTTRYLSLDYAFYLGETRRDGKIDLIEIMLADHQYDT